MVDKIKKILTTIVKNSIPKDSYIISIKEDYADNTYNIKVKFAFSVEKFNIFNNNQFVIEDIFSDSGFSLDMYFRYIGA